MWEFSGYSGTSAANLGYTFGQPNIVRLRNGKWAVLVPAGYFQDPATDSADPTSSLPAAQSRRSSLFVLDAEDGSVITELKTPSANISYGLSTAAVGSYGRDQMADFAVAGDLVGNLWRFDLTDLSTVDLMFSPATNGAQPITVMPQLFPDTTSQGVIAVFGTGKYLGVKDRDTKSMPVQAYYGIREYGPRSNKYPVRLADLVQQTLTVDTATTYRSLTGNAVPVTRKGWYFNLDKVEGERNVLRAGRLVNSNRAVLESLIPAGDDPCDPSIKGALMIVDAATGGPPAGPPPVGGGPALPAGSTQVVGRQVKDPPTTGAPPMVTPPGGGSVIVPGTDVPGLIPPVTISDAYWRRRAWRTMSDGL
jgi:type IV pilus assembly protein PilY1